MEASISAGVVTGKRRGYVVINIEDAGKPGQRHHALHRRTHCSEAQITTQFSRVLERDEQGESWLFAGFDFNFFRDEAEGYFLNSTSPEPCWFVMWRMETEYQPYLEPDSMGMVDNEDGAGLAVPHRLMLSYNEAARLIDGGEQVDTTPLQAEMKAWLADYVAANYKPEPKKRAKPVSFKGANRPAES